MDAKGGNSVEPEGASQAPGYEVMAVQLWRRVAPGSQEPDLSVSEAAAALGVSVETIRRRIRSGALQAKRDGGGKYRVALSLSDDATRLAAVTSAAETNDEIVRLKAELAETRAQLEAGRRHNETLMSELNAAMRAVGESQTELLQLWRQIGAGPIGAQILGPRQIERAQLHGGGSDRIQAMILDARNRFRRRRYPWPLAG
jgi:excisionase family DNA binding protein